MRRGICNNCTLKSTFVVIINCQADYDMSITLNAAAGLQIGGSGVLVQPMTYIFDEEPVRWRRLLDMLDAAPE